MNKEKQRVENNKITREDGQHSLNDLLDTLAKVLTTAYNNELKNGIPQPETLKTYLDNFFNQNQGKSENGDKFFSLIDRFVSGEIKNKGKDKSPDTLDNYHAVKQHLLAYEAKTKSKITFESINLNFFYSYIAFLKTLKN